MSTLKYENWDSATPPAAPTGWVFQSGGNLVTAANGVGTPFPITIPNMIECPAGGAGRYAAIWQTQDGVSGNVSISGTGQFYGSSGINTVSFNVFGRASSSSNPFGSGNCYFAEISGDSPGADLNLYKVISGTPTSLASVLSFTFSYNLWYQIILILNTTAIGIQVIRSTDGYYLTSSSTWIGSQTSAIQIVDSSVTGQGYAGWGGSATGSLPVYGDDWTLSGLSAPAIPPRPHIVSFQQHAGDEYIWQPRPFITSSAVPLITGRFPRASRRRTGPSDRPQPPAGNLCGRDIFAAVVAAVLILHAASIADRSRLPR